MTKASLSTAGRPNAPAVTSLQELLDRFEGYGGTARDYLHQHYGRFAETLVEFDGSWDRSRGVRLLDVGAHWLHQAVLWRLAGYEVTAVDLPATFELDSVRRCAEAEGIKLVPNADLERCPPLADLPDASFHVVLFTEIIEHLTFNPTHLWQELHRLLAPGGRIVITTPNYYAWNGRAWDFKRFFSGFGGGITVDEILNMHTHGHHWREFAITS
jgi:2-polyprenyl-6-hydroxyphenyl methylase/3-demethylubiquinone-9 3-methyltransferase